MSESLQTKTSPFHLGEREIQERLGVREQVEEIGRRFIHDHMPDEHRAFYQHLPVEGSMCCTAAESRDLFG